MKSCLCDRRDRDGRAADIHKIAMDIENGYNAPHMVASFVALFGIGGCDYSSKWAGFTHRSIVKTFTEHLASIQRACLFLQVEPALMQLNDNGLDVNVEFYLLLVVSMYMDKYTARMNVGEKKVD